MWIDAALIAVPDCESTHSCPPQFHASQQKQLFRCPLCDVSTDACYQLKHEWCKMIHGYSMYLISWMFTLTVKWT